MPLFKKEKVILLPKYIDNISVCRNKLKKEDLNVLTFDFLDAKTQIFFWKRFLLYSRHHSFRERSSLKESELWSLLAFEKDVHLSDNCLNVGRIFEVIYLGNNIENNKKDSNVSRLGWAENSYLRVSSAAPIKKFLPK